jgi:hypothetical protein
MSPPASAAEPVEGVSFMPMSIVRARAGREPDREKP